MHSIASGTAECASLGLEVIKAKTCLLNCSHLVYIYCAYFQYLLELFWILKWLSDVPLIKILSIRRLKIKNLTFQGRTIHSWQSSSHTNAYLILRARPTLLKCYEPTQQWVTKSTLILLIFSQFGFLIRLGVKLQHSLVGRILDLEVRYIGLSAMSCDLGHVAELPFPQL